MPGPEELRRLQEEMQREQIKAATNWRTLTDAMPDRPIDKAHPYERFTDRARKVMQLANQEALRLNHEYLGTEHMLLGLIKEGSGVAANVLKNLEINLRNARTEIERVVQPGPEIISMGKMPQSPRAKQAVANAIDEAINLGHHYIGTEHMLLGLLTVPECVAVQVMLNLGLKPELVREETLGLLGQKGPAVKAERGIPVESPCAQNEDPGDCGGAFVGTLKPRRSVLIKTVCHGGWLLSLADADEEKAKSVAMQVRKALDNPDGDVLALPAGAELMMLFGG